MNKTLFDDIVRQLLPEMGNQSSREALVQSALFGSPVLDHIDWSGNAKDFTVRLLKKLYDYDVTCVVAILSELQKQVGTKRQAEIITLIQLLTVGHDPVKGPTIAMDTSILISFLVEIGRWAKSELSERWQLQRKQQTTDLTDRSSIEGSMHQTLEDIETEKTAQEVVRITKLIERKRNAIDRVQNARLADREEYDAQKLTKSALEQREKEHNQTIRQMLNEIEVDLISLGFNVDRSSD